MASLDSLKVRETLARGTVVQKASDQPIAIRLMYKGTGTVTSVTTVTATSVAVITTSGTVTADFATYTTVGAVADKLAANGEFEVKVLDVLRSAASDNNLLASALTAPSGYDENGNEVYDVTTDTSAFFQIGACLSPARGFGTPAGHRVHLQEFVYLADVGTAAYGNLQIWSRKGRQETLIWNGLNVDHATTANTVNFAGGNGKITGVDGEEFIVLVKDGASLADTGYMRVTGIIE